jgi:hypothetical protein
MDVESDPWELDRLSPGSERRTTGIEGAIGKKLWIRSIFRLPTMIVG